MNKSRLFATTLVAALVLGCAERYVVPPQVLMRGQVIDDAIVSTADGYEYSFDRAVVDGHVLRGTLLEEVELVDEKGNVYVATESRNIELSISDVIEVQSVKRKMSSNTMYVAGAVGAGALVYAVVSGSDLIDGRARGSGPAIKTVDP